jgi:transcription antitermination factor NusG
VLQLLRSGDKPAKVPDHIINEIRGRERNGLIRLPQRQRWQRGDRVRIGKGIFLGQIGLFDGMSARERVFVLLNLFGRQTRAQIPCVDLQDAC